MTTGERVSQETFVQGNMPIGQCADGVVLISMWCCSRSSSIDVNAVLTSNLGLMGVVLAVLALAVKSGLCGCVCLLCSH